MTWTVSFYSSAVEVEILALPAGFVARFVRYAERMEIYGPDLGMPHTRPWETDCSSSGSRPPRGIARVFYYTVVGRRIVVLHQFVKKTERTPRKELEVARRRLKEVKDI